MVKRFNLALILGLLLFNLALANQGGSDTFGYMWTDSQLPSKTIDYEWIDVRDGAEIFFTNMDDAVSTNPVSLGFNFTYYGHVYSQVYVSTNGFISFLPLASSYPQNDTIPVATAPDSIIAPYWDDLDGTTTNGKIYKKVVGTAPNRKFIIQWDNFKQKNATAGTITFQVVLYEGSNLIKFQYNNVDTAVADSLEGISATVGIKAGGTGVLYSYLQQKIFSFSSILFHNKTLGTATASIAPNQVTVNTSSQEFTYRLFNVDPLGAAGLGKVDRLAIANPFAGFTPTVTSVKMDTFNAYIRYVTDPDNPADWPTDPGYAIWGIVADSVVMRTYYFDATDSLIVNFIQGVPSTTSTGNQYPSTYNAYLDSTATQVATEDATQTWRVDVVEGPVAGVKIYLDAAGTTELGDTTLTAGETLTLYAGSVDAQGNFLGLVAADWQVKPGVLGQFENSDSVLVADSIVTFTAQKAGNGHIEISYTSGANTYTDLSGLLTVQAGAASYILLRSEANNGGTVLSGVNRTITTDSTMVLYAAHYDAYDNYVGDLPVEWITNNLDTVYTGLHASVTYDPRTTSTGGTIGTNSTTLTNDVTGTIVVNVGSLSYIVIRDATPPAGSEIGTLNLTAGDSVEVFASGYDADGNFIANQSSNWSWVGDAIGNYKISTASTSNVFYATTVGTANLTATTVSGGLQDQTSAISVSAGNPDSLQKVAETDQQSAPAGQALPIPIKVIVKDAYGNRVPNVTVTWVPKKGGTVSPTSSLTDSYGVAQTTWTLHTTLDTDTVAAYVGTFTTTPDTVYFSGYPEAASGRTMVYVDAAADTVRTGAVMTTVGPFRVQVLDSLNNPLSGVEVNFAVTSRPDEASRDSLYDEVVLTDASGIAQTYLRLGTKLGTYQVKAYTNANPNQLPFKGVADTPGAADSIIIVAGNHQTGTVGQALTDSVKVKLVDLYLNPLSGETITFDVLAEGDTTFPASQLTDGNGLAAASWQMGTASGNYHLIARHQASGIASDTLIATANPGAASLVSLVNIRGVAADSVSALENAAVPFVVKVEDQYGNPLSGQQVTFDAPGYNATLSQSTVNTGSTGEASNSVTLDNASDVTIVQAYVPGADTTLVHIFRIQYVDGTLTPASAAAGDSVQFSLQVNNPGPYTTRLDLLSSTLSFTDGTRTYQAALASPDSIPGLTSGWSLTFQKQPVDSQFLASEYQPKITLNGTGTDQNLTGYFFTETGSFGVYSANITSVTVQSPAAHRITSGDQASFTLNLTNQGSSTINLVGSNTFMVLGADTFYAQSNQSVYGNATTAVNFIPKTVNTAASATPLQGTLFLEGTISSIVYRDTLIVSDSISVDDVPNIVIDQFNITADTVSQGESSVTATLTLSNVGALNASAEIQSISLIGQLGTPQYSVVSPALPVQIAADGSQVFNLTVSFAEDYPTGTEIIWPEISYADVNTSTTYSVTGATTHQDTVEVLSRAQLAVDTLRSLDNPVSQGQQNVRIRMVVRNNGQSMAILDDASIAFQNNHTIVQSPTFPRNVAGLDTVVLNYLIDVNSNSSIGKDPISGTLSYRDQLSNNSYSYQHVPTDSLDIVGFDTTLVTVEAVLINPVYVNIGQTGIPAQVRVRNAAQADIQVDSLKLLFSPQQLNQQTQTTLPKVVAGGTEDVFDLSIDVPNNALTGTVTVDAVIYYTESVSNRQFSRDNASIKDSLIVQIPAQLVTLTMDIGEDSVSTGSSGIPAIFEVVNTGGADASITSVVPELLPIGSDLEVTRVSPVNIPFTLAGGDTERFVYRIKTGTNIGWQYLKFVVNGEDENDGSALGPLQTNTDSLYVQEAGDLRIDSVVVRVDTVITGQTNIPATVYLRNVGSANVVVSSVLLQFSQSGFTQGVHPDDETSFTLGAGATDSVRFLFNVEGDAAPGQVIVGAKASGIEKNKNEPVSALASQSDLITVLQGGGLYVQTVQVVGIPRTPYVDYNQIFTLRVVVRNTSEERLRDVHLQVFREDQQVGDSLISFIAPNSTGTMDFDLRAPAVSGGTVYRAKIVSGYSVETGQLITINQPEDNTEVLFVQKPAQLNLTLAPDTTISVDQEFTVQATVQNVGEAPVGSGSVRLVLPASNSVTTSDPLVRGFTSVDTVLFWTVKGAIQTLTRDTILAVFENVPLDLNTNQLASVSKGTDSVFVSVDTSATIQDVVLDIISPPGAVDRTVSTGQLFTIQASVDFRGSLLNRQAELTMPPGVGFALQSPSVQPVAGENGNRVTWVVQAPDTVGTGQYTFQVTVTAIAELTQQEIQKNAQITVHIQDRSLLKLSSAVVSPEGAKDGIVSTNQWLVLRYKMENLGQVGTLDSSLVTVALPSGFSFSATTVDTTDTLKIPTGDSIDVSIWTLNSSRPIQIIKAEVQSAALDSNANQPAAVQIAQASNGVQIVPRAFLSIQDSIVAPPGAQDDTVTVGQTFQYQVLVRNVGVAAVQGTGTLRLVADTLLTVQSGADFVDTLETEFTVGQPLLFTLKAEDPVLRLLAEVPSFLRVEILQAPLDENSQQPAVAENGGIRTHPIWIQEAGDYIVNLQIPDRISTEQLFEVRAVLQNTSQLSETRTAALVLVDPVNFDILDDSVKTFTGDTVVWRVQGPVNISQDSLTARMQVTVNVTETNSGEMLQLYSSVRSLVVERKALLSLIATAEGETSLLLSFKQEFTIVAQVTNEGKAGLVGAGRLKLTIPDTSFRLVNSSDSLEKTIQWNGKTGTVSWTLKAPEDKITTTTLKVEFAQLPYDVNTGRPAELDPAHSTASLAISTQPHRLRVRRLAEVQPDNNINQQGQTNLPLLGLELINGNRFVQPVTIDSIRISLRSLGGTGEILPSPGKILKSVKIGNLAFYEGGPGAVTYAEYTVSESADSVLFIVFNQTLALAPGDTGSLVVLVDIRENAPNVSFKLRINKLYAFDATKNEIEVVDEQGRDFNLETNEENSSVQVNIVSSDEEKVFGNYPNPFGNSDRETKFVFLMKEPGTAELQIFTLLGGLVYSTKVDVNESGLYDGLLTWDGRNNAGRQVLNGVYIAILKIQYRGGGSKQFKTKVAYIK